MRRAGTGVALFQGDPRGAGAVGSGTNSST